LNSKRCVLQYPEGIRELATARLEVAVALEREDIAFTGQVHIGVLELAQLLASMDEVRAVYEVEDRMIGNFLPVAVLLLPVQREAYGRRRLGDGGVWRGRPIRCWLRVARALR
jgi:hypothetical protein